MERIFNLKEIDIVAKEILEYLLKQEAEAGSVLGLSGELGLGKTTLTQAIARELGVVEQVVSPTFILMRKYKTTPTAENLKIITELVHIDAYRMVDSSEAKVLGLEALTQKKGVLTIIEWPERCREYLPKNIHKASLIETGDEERKIIIL